MSSSPATAQPLSVQSLAKRIFRRACEDLSVAHETIATALHRNRTKVDRWASPDADEAMPLWPLLESSAISDALFERIVSDVRAARSERGTAPRAEGVAGVLLGRLGSAVTEIAEALSDGRITSLEAPRVIKRISDVERECQRLRRCLDHVEASGVQ